MVNRGVLVQVFLSHAAEDAGIAHTIKKLVEQCSLGKATVWFSSDTSPSGGMVPGGPWFDQLFERLGGSNVFVALVTARSRNNLWMLYETGCAAVTKIAILPIVIGVAISDLPQPLSLYNAISASSPDGLKRTLMKLYQSNKIPFDEVMLETPVQTAARAIGEADMSLMAMPKDADDPLDKISRQIENRFVELLRRLPAAEKGKSISFSVELTVQRGKGVTERFLIEVDDGTSMQDFTDSCYFNLAHLVGAYKYLEEWVIRDLTWGVNLILRDFTEFLKAAAIIKPGHRYAIILLSKPYNPAGGPRQALA